MQPNPHIGDVCSATQHTLPRHLSSPHVPPTHQQLWAIRPAPQCTTHANADRGRRMGVFRSLCWRVQCTYVLPQRTRTHPNYMYPPWSILSPGILYGADVFLPRTGARVRCVLTTASVAESASGGIRSIHGRNPIRGHSTFAKPSY